MPWFKGNTHTHSYVSDGDTSPSEVLSWYKSHGYDFVCMTDHNHPFDPTWAAGVVDAGFLAIPGVEITTVAERLPVHVNGLGITAMPELRTYPTIEACLQGAIDGIRALGGVPIVNHPNFHWALESKHLLGVRNCKLFEVWNASTDCNNLGVGGRKSTDEFWDGLIKANHLWYGIASDDSHDFQGEFWGYKSLPGQAFVMVEADKLEQTAILTALELGHFYSSTGILLEKLNWKGRTLELEIKPEHHYAYSSELIAGSGKVLEVAHGTKIKFALPESVPAARVRVFDSNGSRLWTQVFGG